MAEKIAFPVRPLGSKSAALHLAAAALMTSGSEANDPPGCFVDEFSDIEKLVATLPRRKWQSMGRAHDYPPSPFESRQVRRARERRERKAMNS